MDEIAPEEDEIQVEEAEEAEDQGPPAPDEQTIAVAEEPGLWLPDEPTRMVFHGDGFAFVSTAAPPGCTGSACRRTTPRSSGS